MGKTVLPFSQVLEQQQQEFSKFRRALRAEDQEAFDALFEAARLHIQAAVYYANPYPAEALFMSVLIENWKLVDGLQERLSEVERQLKELRASHGETAA